MIGFLIEEEIWEDDEAGILSSLTGKDVPFVVHPMDDFDHSILQKLDTPLIFCYGSLQWIAQVQADSDPRLKTICSMPQFDCRIYYPFFRDFLFNNTHRMISLADFISEIDQLLAEFGGKLFMRPCTGFKTGSISGGVFDRAAFDMYISFFQEELKPEDMLVIDSVRHMDYEWRAIMCGSECITGCQYGSFDSETQKFGVDPSSDFPDHVRLTAERFARDVKWAPDPIYVMDLVQSGTQVSVMEINALSTSGWYNCDTGLIVDAIREEEE